MNEILREEAVIIFWGSQTAILRAADYHILAVWTRCVKMEATGYDVTSTFVVPHTMTKESSWEDIARWAWLNKDTDYNVQTQN